VIVLADSLASVLERIDRACHRAGRDRSEVRLVAVSKTVAVERIGKLLDLGHDLFGENRVQEALSKIPQLGSRATWHLVGHLQRNKVRQVIGLFELIHAVDNLKLGHEIDRRAAAVGLRQPVLLQVNVSEEPTKQGVDEAGLPKLLDGLGSLEHVDLLGLMTIPPPVERPDDSRPWFVRLRALRDRAAARLGRELPELSMGMTDDFEVAIEEGATLIRVGRAIFGERSPGGLLRDGRLRLNDSGSRQ